MNLTTVLFHFAGLIVTTNFVTVFTLLLGMVTIMVTLYNRFRDIRYKKFDYTTKVLEIYVNEIVPEIGELELKIRTFKRIDSFLKLSEPERVEALMNFEIRCGIQSIFNKIELTGTYMNKRNVVFRKLIDQAFGEEILAFMAVHDRVFKRKFQREHYQQITKLLKRYTDSRIGG